MDKIKQALQNTVIGIITLYQRFISPLLGNHCRFQPTCSTYAKQAIAYHGILKGSWLALRRVIKCHPLHAGGDDPVPMPPSSNHQISERN